MCRSHQAKARCQDVRNCIVSCSAFVVIKGCMSKKIDIANGPSKFDIMVSLFDSGCQGRKSVCFQTATGVVLVFVDSVEREDGSGESWNIKGRVKGPSPVVVLGTKNSVAIYFSSATRKGCFLIS